MLSPGAKVKIQSFGRFLSNMVMPNIGAFIAWGFITALFIKTGWIPNAYLAKLVGPMVTYMLPLLLGYTGGKLIGGERGAVVGAIATMGVVIGTNVPMFLGAMIAGPIGGWSIKHFDRLVEGKIKAGFEMLVSNFSAGIIGMILAILGYMVFGPIVEHLSALLAAGVNILVEHDLLPLTSIFVEPAKVLFLNNAIGNGILVPLGIQQAHSLGQSAFFLIEANPGPGFGLLLAYSVFGRGTAKQSAPGACIIQFLGGIHEIYFPYVLMNPRLIIAMIAGGMTGVFTLVAFHAGLVAPASPGSIIAVLLMTPQHSFVGVILSVVLSCLVSFTIASLLLKTQRQTEEQSLSSATDKMKTMKAESKGQDSHNESQANGSVDYANVQKIVVACDAGMGSSAMGAGLLRKKMKNAGLDISVTNTAINDLPSDVNIVITHRDLTNRARKSAPQAEHLSLTNFLEGTLYDDLIEKLKQAQSSDAPAAHATQSPSETQEAAQDIPFKLTLDDVKLGLKANSKEEAIRFAGEQLAARNYIKSDYIEAMLERESMVSTYLGESIAVPHGTIEAKHQVLKTGIVFCQYPEGIQWGDDPDDVARLVIAIAAQNDEHLQVISAVTNALDISGGIDKLATTTDPQEVLNILNA
ncbi:PTS mannitol transporter subunit IICBA [Celerinatantimonas diazotrophica]|uniref:PTS system mannitol-specific EIICBA component n=1 Tax=Celerinatantimonas diazotrophica TaxID=412034 RepID=A0A4R1J9N1_9GAMM|nr:PTS mannitol transporter subunit IICBA [Celerinatantimonas diazotrophica]TCK47323.1 PTS system D-mannitol-specific IIA component (Fru family) /PTS system D-mannitol-specific IIB component (Fru family) /PTS system D-mannitol-specific IIC component (Fru family) [Celerinatantimonas diazotrophica]CAG9295061.1 PTS system mannitol-specific EIICBA component [Celerinatantimonas diazotrophica]